jgi:gamma-glutamyltranspeptidase/glutathione hydrolase
LDFEMSVSESIAGSRFHHQWVPNEIRVEKSLPEAIVTGLQELGHRVNTVSRIGVSQAIGFDREEGLFHSSSDPRVEGAALAF